MTRNRGFTLIEVVMALTITAIMGVGLSLGYAKSVEVYLASVMDSELAMESAITLEKIARELRHAGDVIEPSEGSSGDRLSFTKPSVASCFNCIDNSPSVLFTYSPQKKQILRITDGSGQSIMADNVASFSVTSKPSSLYHISITRVSAKTAFSKTVTFETTVLPLGKSEYRWMEDVR